MIKQAIFSLLFFASTFLFSQTELETKLFELPDVVFQKVKTADGFEASYVLRIKQAIDHQNPEKGTFFQRVWLNHKSYDAVNVLGTAGYQAPNNRIYDITQLLEANQFRVEHRFFDQSVPEPKDWQYLTLEQATADLHKVNQLLRKIYSGKWVSTGISKGGMTTIFYRYFYPDDVDVSMPYVAPLDTCYEDPRIYSFLKNVGTEECRSALKAVQIRLLGERHAVMPRLKYYEKALNHTFDYLGFEAAFEYAVLEYPFSFWQWGHQCDDIPMVTAHLDTILDHFIKVIGMSFFSDQEIAAFAPHYYQAATQTGYYGYETDGFETLLKSGTKKYHATFQPDHMETKYDPSLSQEVFKWIQDNGNQFIYIYGANDTWTAAAIPESEKVDAHWFILEGQDHGGARIINMKEEEKAEMINALEKWLEIDIKK